ncbi:hypothetical protein Bpfe_000557 [Biomphalaria pfeifferi]|uniref:Uncharacterized protein n=1 Tax=Biomphalaria pfeifferi TaxID=112525 RepID=A0AAD8FM50_BIOPF|nr:hypothetical protein Bpfe_000557 [Biomphalaria pfeifferi]
MADKEKDSKHKAVPSSSPTRHSSGAKTDRKTKRAPRFSTKLLNAIRIVGDEYGAPLEKIGKYLVDNENISQETVGFKVLRELSNAVKKGIVTVGAATDINNWLFRLAGSLKHNTKSKDRDGKKGKRGKKQGKGKCSCKAKKKKDKCGSKKKSKKDKCKCKEKSKKDKCGSKKDKSGGRKDKCGCKKDKCGCKKDKGGGKKDKCGGNKDKSGGKKDKGGGKCKCKDSAKKKKPKC